MRRRRVERRKLVRSLLIGALVLAFVAAATPAAAEATHVRFQGRDARAQWVSDDLFAVVHLFPDEDYLIVYMEMVNRDSAGDITGFTVIAVDANLSPYGTFTMDNRQLSTATLDVSDVPATTCQYDENFNLIECADLGTVDVSVTWTGYGLATRTGATFHEVSPGGFVIIERFRGTLRYATASGTIDGTTLTAEDNVAGFETHLSVSSQGSVTVCIEGC